jgi:hypothetical protein
MPYRFEFDAQHKILLVVVEGDVETSDLRTFIEDVRTRVDQLHPAAGITDFSAITAFSAALKMVRAAASLPAPYPDETPRFIIAREDYLFGIARMFELVANRPNAKLKVLRCREEALAMLGVQNTTFEKLQ